MSIKIGYAKEGIFLENLKNTLCQQRYVVIKSFPVPINLKDREKHKVDIFVQDKIRKIIYCLNIKGKATNFNTPASTLRSFIETIIVNVKNKFLGYKVVYIFVKEDFFSDSFFDVIKTFPNVKVINYVEFQETFSVASPTDRQIETRFLEILKKDLIENDFNLKIISKIFSKILS